MAKKGAFGISFQVAFGILAALFIGMALFAMTPPLLNRLSEYSDVFVETLDINMTEYEQVAKDSAHGMRVALSCTALMNAQNENSEQDYIDYLEDEWTSWKGGVCDEATESGGVVVGEEDEIQEPVTVECDEPDFGTSISNSCRVHNFNLPNNFGGFDGPDNFLGHVEAFLRAKGEPEYFLYYQSFPDYGIESDWEEAYLTDEEGHWSFRFWSRVMTNYLTGATIGMAGYKYGASNVLLNKKGTNMLSDTTKSGFLDRFLDLGAEWMFTAGGRVAHEAIWGVHSYFSFGETAEDIRNNFVSREFNRYLGKSMDKLMDDYGTDVHNLFDHNDVRVAVQEYMGRELSDQITGNPYYREVDDFDVEELSELIEYLASDAFNVDETNIDADEIAESLLEELFDEGFVLESIVNRMEYGKERARTDVLTEVDDKRYYQGIQNVRNIMTAEIDPEEPETINEILEAFIENYNAMEQMIGGEDNEELERQLSIMKTLGCGSGAFERYHKNENFDSRSIDEIEDSYLGQMCENAVSEGEFCETSFESEEQAKSACIASSVISMSGMKELSKQIRYDSVGINSIGLKKTGVVEPKAYDLHPVANWYYVSLEPEGEEENELAGAGRRFYSVSPCRTEPGDEGESSYVEVNHRVESCYMGPEAEGYEFADSDFVWTDTDYFGEHVDEEDRISQMNRLGAETVPTEVFMFELQGSFYRRDERFENIPFLEGLTGADEDIIYTSDPFVVSKPKFYSSEEFLTETSPSGIPFYAVSRGKDILQSEPESVYDMVDNPKDHDNIEEVEEPCVIRDLPLDEEGFELIYSEGRGRGSAVRLYCRQGAVLKEGWNSQMMVENPYDPDAPGLDISDVRSEVRDAMMNLAYLEGLRIEQFEETLEKEHVYENEHNRHERLPDYQSVDFKEGVWEAARTVPGPEKCREDIINTEIYKCENEEEITVIEGNLPNRGDSCGDPNEDSEESSPELQKFLGGEIIEWEDYCEAYSGNASIIRDYMVGGDQPENSVYYSQIGYWLPENETLYGFLEEINELNYLRSVQISEILDRDDLIYNQFILPGFFDYDIWNKVPEKAGEVIEDLSQVEIDIEDKAENTCEEIKPEAWTEEGIPSDEDFRYFKPRCLQGDFYDVTLDGNDYCGMEKVAESDKVREYLIEEHIGEEREFRVNFDSVKVLDYFETHEDYGNFFIPSIIEAEDYYDRSKFISKHNDYREKEVTIVFTEDELESSDIDYLTVGDILDVYVGEEYDEDEGRYGEKLFYNVLFDFEPLDGGETIEFMEYCTGFMENVLEMKTRGAEFSIGTATDPESDEPLSGTIHFTEEGGVIPSVPERHISSSGTGSQKCIQPSVANEFFENFETFDVFNKLDEGLTREVDSLSVSYRNTMDDRNYCYSSMTHDDTAAQILVGGGSSLIQTTIWKASLTAGPTTGGLSALAGGAMNFGISIAEAYVAYSIKDNAEWPDHTFNWEEKSDRWSDALEFPKEIISIIFGDG